GAGARRLAGRARRQLLRPGRLLAPRGATLRPDREGVRAPAAARDHLPGADGARARRDPARRGRAALVALARADPTGGAGARLLLRPRERRERPPVRGPRAPPREGPAGLGPAGARPRRKADAARHARGDGGELHPRDPAAAAEGAVLLRRLLGRRHG